jgi:hypothetical protein
MNTYPKNRPLPRVIRGRLQLSQKPQIALKLISGSRDTIMKTALMAGAALAVMIADTHTAPQRGEKVYAVTVE